MAKRACWTPSSPVGRTASVHQRATTRLTHLDVLYGQYKDEGLPVPAKLRHALNEAARKAERTRAKHQRAVSVTRSVCGPPPARGILPWTPKMGSSADAINAARRGAERERKKLRLPKI